MKYGQPRLRFGAKKNRNAAGRGGDKFLDWDV